MPAGLNLTGRIWRFSYDSDDSVGGALPSGTVLYSNVFSRIQAEKPTLALLEQGLETPEIFTAILSPGTLDLNHNDQYEVTGPPISSYYNKRFRIIGIQHTGMEDERKFLMVTLRRIDEAHSNATQ